MPVVRARAVDPRDTTWETWEPGYRVYFWRPLGPEGAWSSREFEILAGDADDVIVWALQHAIDSETYTVFVVVEHAGERGLIPIVGVDPTRADRA